MGAVPSWGASVAWGHSDVGPALIHDDEPRRIKRDDLLPPGSTTLFVALAGGYGLFFRVQAMRRCMRLIVGLLTRTPLASSQRAQCSSNVMSGWAVSWAMSAG